MMRCATILNMTNWQMIQESRRLKVTSYRNSRRILISTTAAILCVATFLFAFLRSSIPLGERLLPYLCLFLVLLLSVIYALSLKGANKKIHERLLQIQERLGN
ncbi:MAG: hypothetical protein V1754_02740 [Pseudomonadota bacterium]